MSYLLYKGKDISLSKELPSVRGIRACLSWEPRKTDGLEFDLDLSAFLLDYTGKVSSKDEFIFFDNLTSSDGSVKHLGDNRTGLSKEIQSDALAKSEDKIQNPEKPVKLNELESIDFDLYKIRPDIQKIVIVVNIYDGVSRHQNFGMIENSTLQLKDIKTNRTLASFDLSEDLPTQHCLVHCALIRESSEWIFRGIEKECAGGLTELVQQYGLKVVNK